MDDDNEKSIPARMFLSQQFKPSQTQSDERFHPVQKLDAQAPVLSRYEKLKKESLSGSFVSFKTTGSGGKEFLTTSTSGSHNGSLILHDSESENGDNLSDASGTEKHNLSTRSMNCSEDEDSKEFNIRLKSVSTTSIVKKEIMRTPEKFIRERSSVESPFNISPFIFEGSPDHIPSMKSKIDFSHTLFSSELISFCSRHESTNLKIFIHDLIYYVSTNKTISMENQCNKFQSVEAIYSYFFQNSDFETLLNVLNLLIQELSKEPKEFRDKIQSEFKYISHKFTRLKDCNSKSISIEEKEINSLYKHLSKIFEFSPDVSLSAVKGAIHFIKFILKKFPSHERTFSVSRDRDIVIDYITPQKLLEKCLESSHALKEVLIYTYDLYMTNTDLILYLICKYFPIRPLGVSKSELKAHEESYEKVKVRILKILQFWIEERPLDFIMNKSLIYFLNEFITFISKSDCNTEIIKISKVLYTYFKDVAAKMLITRDKSNPEYEDSELKKDFNRASTTLNNHSFLRQKSYDFRQSLDCMSSLEEYNFERFCKEDNHTIAKQLTLIDFKRFKKIDLNEIITKKWLNKDKSGCPYYDKFTKRFNNFSRWIKLVLLSEMNSGRRTELAEKFLDIALICANEYQNFCSSHYIVNALNEELSYIIFKPENKKKFEEIKNLFFDQKNFLKTYEAILKASDPPMIPIHEYFFRKFIKLLESHVLSKTLDQKSYYIKFQTIIRIVELCRELKKFQTIHYNSKFKKDEVIYNYLKQGYKSKFSKIDLNNEDQILKEGLHYREVIKNQIKNV